MKVITKVVIDKSGRTIYCDSYEYDGPIAQCKGGGPTTSTTTTTGEIDYAYNARMAAIAEDQQSIANEYAQFWREEYKPLESAQIAANKSLVETQTETERQRQATERAGLGLEEEKIAAGRELLPEQTELAKEQVGLARSEISAAKPVMSEFYKQALQGVDPDKAVTRARGDVAAGFKGAESAERRALGRIGVRGGAKTQGALRQRFQEQAKATAFASTEAREGAEEQSFKRLAGATAQFKGGI